MNDKKAGLTRIGVFYDGNYFFHVSNYYAYVHPRKSRISVSGLHDYIRHKVAEEEGGHTGYRQCQIVDSHYFRGRLNAYDAANKGNLLFYDRVFDDILMKEGVTTHYLPVKTNAEGSYHEKGIDVWLALEAFEQAYYKRFDLLVLIASDGDYTPLVRKLNTLGTRVMLLSWDFEYKDDKGVDRITRTSQDLLEVVTYPIAMHEEIDNRVSKGSFAVNNIFLPSTPKVERSKRGYHSYMDQTEGKEQGEIYKGEIMVLKNGYGFIRRPPDNLFFYYGALNGVDFSDLGEGDIVACHIEYNEKGESIATNVVLIEDVDK